MEPIVVGPFTIGETVTVIAEEFVVCQTCNGYGTLTNLPFQDYNGPLLRCPYCKRGLVGTGRTKCYNALVIGLAPSDDLWNDFYVHVSLMGEVFDGRGSVSMGYEMDRLDVVVPISIVRKNDDESEARDGS